MKILKELFEKRKVKQDSDGEYPYIMMYGTIDEIIQEAEQLIRKEVLEEVLDMLKQGEGWCVQHYGYATDKQEDEIYLQGFKDMQAFKIIKLLSKIEQLK